MESSLIDFLKRWWWALLGALLALVFVVSWLNTPHQDSSEKPLPRQEEKALRRQIETLTKRADSLRIEADTARAHSQLAYAEGVEAGKEAMELRTQTHQKPVTHAQAPTPAGTKHLQQFFNDY